MALKTKIPCNGIKPTKAMIYTLAAELVEIKKIKEFKVVIIEAMKSYDYGYDYYYDYDYEYYEYYEYDYYDYYDYYYSLKEKVITLLFLAAIYS